MGWLFTKFRYVYTVIRGLAVLPLLPPQNLRFTLGAETSGAFPLTVQWDTPASWGDDADGTGTRGYNGSYQQTLNADGTAHTGAHSTPQTFTTDETDHDHILPNAPVNSVWTFQIRATNRDGDHSDYAHLTIHAVEQGGFLLLDRRFLRVYDGSNWRRLRLTSD